MATLGALSCDILNHFRTFAYIRVRMKCADEFITKLDFHYLLWIDWDTLHSTGLQVMSGHQTRSRDPTSQKVQSRVKSTVLTLARTGGVGATPPPPEVFRR